MNKQDDSDPHHHNVASRVSHLISDVSTLHTQTFLADFEEQTRILI